MKTAVICAIVWIAINTLYCTGDPIAESTEAAPTETTEYISDDVKGTTHWIDIFRGRDGRDGLPGPQGEKGDKGEQGPAGVTGTQGPPGGGVTYTRWGRTVCPNTNGTELVYEGLVAGSYYTNSGGGANYICITKQPTYHSSTIPPGHSLLYGSEYQDTVYNGLHDDNAPCAVCHTSQRSSKLMIPGTRSCPSSWTEEYEGYLMTEYDGHARNAVYECVDKDGEKVPGEGHNQNVALFYHVGVACGYGLPCPPFVSKRPLTCVVCTK